jgi:hypothetical protein
MLLFVRLCDRAQRICIQGNHVRLNLLEQASNGGFATLALGFERVGLESIEVGLSCSRNNDGRVSLLRKDG